MHRFFSFPGLGTIVWFGVCVYLLACILKAVLTVVGFIIVAAILAIPIYGVLRTKFHFEAGLKEMYGVLKDVKFIGEHPLMFGIAAFLALADEYILQVIVLSAIQGVAVYLGWWAVWGTVRKLTGSKYQSYHRAWVDAL